MIITVTLDDAGETTTMSFDVVELTDEKLILAVDGEEQAFKKVK